MAVFMQSYRNCRWQQWSLLVLGMTLCLGTVGRWALQAAERVLEVAAHGIGDVDLMWPTSTNRTYQFQRGAVTGIGIVWTNATPPFVGSGRSVTCNLWDQSATSGLFRVEATGSGRRETPATGMELTLVDEDAIGYASFQSHNRKVVATSDGIFITYNKRASSSYNNQTWRLVRSTDGGATFQVIFEGDHSGHTPPLEADSQGRLYVITTHYSPNLPLGEARVLRFERGANTPTTIAILANGYSGKMCAVFDQSQNSLFVSCGRSGDRDNTLFVIAADGVLTRAVPLFTYHQGQHAFFHYPHLDIGESGSLAFAWTTSPYPEYYPHFGYWSIHGMRSLDAGANWRKFDQTSLALPFFADDTGPSDRITADDEFTRDPFLGSMMEHQGKTHFVYWRDGQPQEQMYVRINNQSGAREVVRSGVCDAWANTLTGFDAGFDGAFSRVKGGNRLFLTTSIEGQTRLAIAATEDNGDSWREYALADTRFMRGKYHGVYSVSPARETTPDGWLIGVFTRLEANSESFFERGSGKLYFFRARAGASIPLH